MKRALFIMILLWHAPSAWAQSPSPAPAASGAPAPAVSATPRVLPSGAPSPSMSVSPSSAATPAVSATPNVATGGTPAPAVSATPAPEVTKAPENPAHQELRDLRTRMQSAMNSGDVEQLLSGVTDDVVFSTMNGDVVRGKDGIRDYFTKMMSGPDAIVKSVSTNFEADDLTLLYGGTLGETEDAGVAFGHSTDSYELKDGSKFTVTPRWTATMIRDPEGWKIASFHYSVSMFENPVTAKYKESMTMVGGGAALIGLLLGVILGLMIGRRKK